MIKYVIGGLLLPVVLCTPSPSIASGVEEMYRVVSLESYNDYEGALAVASVIMNRVERGETLLGVLSARGQFSTYRNPDRSRITPITIVACNDALQGKRNVPKECYYFCAQYAYRHSSNKIVYAKIGGNVFYGYK